MSRSADVDDVQIGIADRAIEMGINEVEPGRGAPMPEQPRLDMFGLQRLLE